MNKKRNAVMLADTRPALVGVVLLQLSKTNKGLFDEAIIYYIDEICETDRKKMQEIMPCRFIKYVCPLQEEIFKKPRFALFSPLMFVRYEMTNYLDEFETVTWLDTDILIQGDISGLLEAAKKTGAAFIREDPVHKTAEKPDRMRTCFRGEIKGFHLDEYLYCSGTIVYTDQYVSRIKGFTEWCYEKTYEWSDILDLPDQGVLNAAIQHFHLQITPVSGKTYCCYPYQNRDCSEAKIIHAWGLNKFWNDWYVYKNYSGWAKIYDQWLAGGSPLPFEIRPQISVVIPVYKPDLNLFGQCMDSLMKQNRNGWERYSDFEIIIVAEPYEQDALKEFAEAFQDHRIRLIFNDERRGIAASLNRGIRAAQGKYIARMDDDDIAAGRRLYLQKQYLDEHPQYDLCTSDFEYFGDMNEKRVSFEGEMSRAWSVLTCPFDHPTVMFRKQFFEENSLFYDETRGFVEDWELWQRAFEKGMAVGCVHETLLYHRWISQSGAGQSSRTIEMMQEMIQKNFRTLEVEVPKEDLQHIGPWNGMAEDEDVRRRVEGYFADALRNNSRLKIYDPDSLKQVFELRRMEMQSGKLPGLVQEMSERNASTIQKQEKYKSPPLRLFLKRMLLPLYRPFKYRFEERLKLAVEKELANEGHIMDCIYKLDEQKQSMEEAADFFKWQLKEQQLLVKEKLDLYKEQIRFQKEHLEQERNLNMRELENLKNQNRLLNDNIYRLQREMRYMKGLWEDDLKMRKKIVLIGTPEHSNAGDAAITLGEIEFIRRYFGEYSFTELSRYDYADWKERTAGLIGKDDILFLQGGGNMGNRYLGEEKLRREIVNNFPENQIVIMPQTIWFEQTPEGTAECSNSADCYNRHKNLMIFVRGGQSLQTAKTVFSNAKAVMMPDMALFLKADFSLRRNGVLLCLRKLEDEGRFAEEDYRKLTGMLDQKQLTYDIETNWYQNDPEKNIYKDMRKAAVYEKLKNYARHQAVITDRLHGMIFAVITNTPCIVLSTYNQKIDEFYEMLKSSNAVFFAGKEPAAVCGMLEQALAVTDVQYPQWEQAYFARMAGIIREEKRKIGAETG